MNRCWCGRAGIEYDLLGVATTCDMACAGDATQLCGGRNTFQLYQYDANEQPAGHVGCFEDNRASRIMAQKNTDTTVTPTVSHRAHVATKSGRGYDVSFTNMSLLQGTA